uniref:Bromo domain-containing protein n=1 Tax=Trypanosoma congolense (strain IL3000) TaxID=1068625 RepID=G0UQ83_TRYCI|nr:conserved hypothetical protein [Trypanosoma congolense IL3000]
MAVVCSGNGVSVSPLWQHFMALDITKTFCATFASELAAVRDERQFAETLAALMSRWRRSNWDEIFLSPTTSTGDPNESGTRGIRKRYTVANVRGRSKDAVHNLNTGVEPAEQKKRDCAVATYYESIRVQRLMDDILFLSPEVVARWEAEEFQRYGCDGIMNLRRKWRRRCALLRAVDEIWRVSVDAGPDFLLPVTELEAPQYYRRIKQPVSVSSLYCGVWDSTVQDYAELKAQLTLMRTNCEEYNGVDSALVVNCRKIVKAGYNAARDAETYERQQETLEQGLVTPASLQKSGDGGMYGAVSLVGVVEDSTLMMPLPPDELRELFPPRREAASRDPEREGNRDDIFDDSDANRNDKKIRGNQNAAKRTLRQVLRLNPRTITAQAVGPAAGSASVDRPVPATTPLLDDDSARPRLRLRPLSLTPAKTTPGAGGDVDAAGTGGEEEGGLWKLTDHRGRERKTERSTRALPGDAEPPRRQESKRLKSVKGEKQSKRKRKRGKSGRDTDDSEEEAVVGVHREPKARREVRTRKEVRQAKNNKAGAVEACKVRRGGTSKVVESRKNRSSGKRRKFRGSSSSGSSSSSSSSSLASYTESLTDSDTQPVQKPSPSITVEELKLLEVAMDQLDAVPLQKQNIKELLSQIKRIEDKLGQYNDS